MQRIVSCKIGWRVSLAILFGALLFASLALTACGGTSAQSSSSAASSSAASSSAASSSKASSSSVSSSAASSSAASSEASQSSAGQQLSEAYVPVKIVTTFDDGATQTTALKYDERGRVLGSAFEMVAPEGTTKVTDTYADWDDFGHYRKTDENCDPGNGNAYTITVESSSLEVNEKGFETSAVNAITMNKESFEAGEAATQKRTDTIEYGNDASTLRKIEYSFENFDQAGNAIGKNSKTYEYDENGLQTAYLEKAVDATGAEQSGTITITWTLDDNGKPTSFQAVEEINDEDPITVTGDVTVNEQGLVTKVSNIKYDGKEYSTTAEVTYEKIDNPLQNAYEGWKSINLLDLITPLF